MHFNWELRVGDIASMAVAVFAVYRAWFKLNGKIDLSNQRLEMRLDEVSLGVKAQSDRLREHEELDRKQFDKITDRLSGLANSLSRLVGRMENFAALRAAHQDQQTEQG